MSGITLHDPLWFGKHKGLCVAAIAKFDPAYLLWIKTNMDLVWSEDALAVAKKAWSRDYYQKQDRQNAWAWGFGKGAKSARSSIDNQRNSIEIEERRKAGLPLSNRVPA